jgi:NNP family nitrate/nitrite transporter-like MFS transporter
VVDETAGLLRKVNAAMARSHRITAWDPEDAAALQGGEHSIARRDLFWLVVNVHVAFSVWYLWSVIVLFMPRDVYGFSTGDKFLLAATASLVGALVRIPYSFAACRCGHIWCARR